MLTDQQIEDFAKDIESESVERKSSLAGSAKEKIGQAICAFANNLGGKAIPGVVLIGVDDQGNPTGLNVTDELLRELAGYRSEGNILPLPNMTVEKRSVDGVDVAVIAVQPSLDPPVRYYGQTWIRVGARRAIAGRDEERILIERRQSGDLPFDRRSVPLAKLSDLDLDFFRDSYLASALAPDILERNQRSLEERLQALHMRGIGGQPTYAAVLLLGKDPRSWIPGAYVQFVRYDGVEVTAPILDQKEINGRLSEVLRRIDDLANINIRIQTQVEGDTVERRYPDHSITALQQLLRNAVLHRTYEVNAPVYWYWFADRIEIHSPGGLYGRVNERNFGQHGATDYRNPTLAEGLKVLGYVQRFGVGIELARRGCRELGNPEPQFTFSPSLVLATLRTRS